MNEIEQRLLHLVSQQPIAAEDLLKKMLSDEWIDSTKRIIEKVDVAVLVHRSCETDPLLLTSTQINALALTNHLRLVFQE